MAQLRPWRETRVLLTGASGFIGAHVLRRLTVLDADVHATSRIPPSHGGSATWHTVDLTDAGATTALVRGIRPDIVLHLAATVSGARDIGMVSPTLRTNVVSPVVLMTALAEDPPDSVVFAGSIEEAALGDPSASASSPYALAKLAATGYATMFHRLWNLPVTVLRIATVYGPGQPDQSKLVPHVITTLLGGVAPRLSRGSKLVDWVYIDDVVTAILTAAQSPHANGHVIEIGSGEQVSVTRTVATIRDILGTDITAEFGVLPDRPFDHDQLAHLDEAARLLDWRPATGLTTGLRRTVEWYRSRRNTMSGKENP
ncbi:NAD-dependent epimerase/dehydratase family protein [Haloechinothrix halophila]|uniref:NAD-dependent epimerase/dehydratase family protein n=1 Tax=Haloechinothrix halophila TaxID=1069073 RepID=UPI0004159092|nr:NAD-dependent epimerase/dehydratase family protein [Haloechinothrix halophila]